MRAFYREDAGTQEGALPPVDLYDAGDSLVFEIDLPGMLSEDIHIHVLGDILVIEGARRDPERGRPLRYICMERSLKRVLRSVEIPVPVDPRMGRAVYRDGVIRVYLPKAFDGPVRIPVEHK